MLHTKEANVALMHSLLIVAPEVADQRADAVEPHSEKELDVHYGSSDMAQSIICGSEGAALPPSLYAPPHSIDHADEHKPAPERVKE